MSNGCGYANPAVNRAPIGEASSGQRSVVAGYLASIRENVRAQLRVLVKRVPRKYAGPYQPYYQDP